MAYSNEIVSHAKATLARMVEDKQSLSRQRLSEVYEKLPRVHQIDIELRRTMVQAAQAAFTQNNTALLDDAKAKNKALQDERETLLRANFPPNFLDESPVCPRCGGTGYIGSSMCQCLSELCRQEQQKNISILAGGKSDFSRFRLDYYPDSVDSRICSSPRELMRTNLEDAKQFAFHFTPDCGNLLLTGNTGLGKTLLSACIAKSVSDRGYSVVYESSGKLFSVLESAKFNSNEINLREAAKYATCDLLILDDLGTEMPGQFTTAALYSLINERLLAKKSIIITTNVPLPELAKRYNPQISSRLQGEFQMMTFLGDDIRVLKSQGKL